MIPVSRLLIPFFFMSSALALPVLALTSGETPEAVVVQEGGITADSCFAHIDSNRYAIGDALPRYAHEVAVGTPCSAGYDVEIRYPEYVLLSGREVKALRRLQEKGIVAADKEIEQDGIVLMPEPQKIGSLNLETYMAMSKKKGYLNISFSPIVLHEGRWKRILSCQIRVVPRQATAANAHFAPQRTLSAAERWAEKSVLETGKWAKIRVEKEGIYQLTDADVKKMGFSSVNNVRIFGYGGLMQIEQFSFPDPSESTLQTTVPDDLVEVPTLATSDGRRLFWAEGTLRQTWVTGSQIYTHTQNPYSKYSYYFITEGTPTAVQKLPAETAQAALRMDVVPYSVVYDNDAFSWYSGGRRMFDDYDFSTGNTHTYRVATPDLAKGDQVVITSFGAASNSDTTPYEITINGTKLLSSSVARYDVSNSSAKVETKTTRGVASLTASGSNAIQITTANNNSARLDYINLNYQRSLTVSDAPYSFSPQKSNAVTLSVSGAGSTTHLWRIGQYGSPTAELASTVSNGVLSAVTSTPLRRFVCFDEAKTYAAPEFVGEVKNQNLHALQDIDYVIIVPANGKLAEQASRLLALHHDREGISGVVVRADEIYNEFSSGTPDANAYRRFLKMLYDRAGDNEAAMPKYCLFMGKCSWDNRLLTAAMKGKSQDDYLLCYEVDGTTNTIGSVPSYVTDDFFSLLDDGEGRAISSEKPDIALGRLVCNSVEEAKILVDKVEKYMSNADAGSWKNTVVMMGDDGDNNLHMDDAERVAQTIESVDDRLDVQRIFWDRYVRTTSATGYSYPQATERINQFMTDGAAIFNYSGHGGPNSISHAQVLVTKDFATARSPYMPLWILASCEIFPFDSDEESLAETSMLVPDGGSIAFMCATRAVYPQQNFSINKNFCQNLLAPSDTEDRISMAEALRRAKVSLVQNSTDLTFNKLKYVFFGDPALRLAIPSGHIVIDSINGKKITASSPLTTLPAGGVARFSGYVCQPGSDKDIDTNFAGIVTATLYDRKEKVVCKDNQKSLQGDNEPFTFYERAKNLYRGNAKAKDGRFEFVLTIPRDISYSEEPGRISLYAISDDKKQEYSGYTENFCMNGTAAEADQDSIPPVVMLYINNIDNPDYTITDENPVLIADIYDECGINNAGVALGHDIELVLDDDNASYINLKSYFNYDFGSYQKGQIVYPMTGISRGLHKASLRVWDVNNNYSVSDVHFIVRGDYHDGMMTEGYITSTQNPAATTTSLVTYFPQNAENPGLVSYEVYDTRGRLVFKRTESVAAYERSAFMVWDLCGNDHQPLPDGVYFYRAVITSSNGRFETEAQKMIIARR